MNNRLSTDPRFDYDLAFSRNMGILSKEEQNEISKKRIAIAGLGGVGGSHLITLVREGFQNFHISDFDRYEQKNLNLQYGAFMDTLGSDKAQVMTLEASRINPGVKIKKFEKISEKNLEEFLEGIDLVVDGIDCFVQEPRRLLFNSALEKNIPVLSAGPLGASVAYLLFKPGGMNYDSYFNVDESSSYERKVLSFVAGVAPKRLHNAYMKLDSMDRLYEILENKESVSLCTAINLCSGIIGAESLKVLLNKGKIYPVPYYHQFDVMTWNYTRGKLRWGNSGPIQKTIINYLVGQMDKRKKS